MFKKLIASIDKDDLKIEVFELTKLFKANQFEIKTYRKKWDAQEGYFTTIEVFITDVPLSELGNTLRSLI